MPESKRFTVERRGIGKPDYSRAVSSSILVPSSPRDVNHIIQAMGLHAVSFFPTTKVSFACPAGVITDLVLPMPVGYYATCTDYVLTSDFYDPNIAVSVLVDGENTTPVGIALTGPTSMEYAEYYVKKVEAIVRVTNDTLINAVVSFQIFACFVQIGFYNSFYKPVIDYMYYALQGVAARA